MPAAAVIPALIAYIKVVAVKKFVVGALFAFWPLDYPNRFPLGSIGGRCFNCGAANMAVEVMVLLTECHWPAAILP